MDYCLTIQPAIPPKQRHEIEKIIERLGYEVKGGGTMLDGSECDISFKTREKVDHGKTIPG